MLTTVMLMSILWTVPEAREECTSVYYTEEQGVDEMITVFDGRIICVISLIPVGTLEEFDEIDLDNRRYL